MKQIINKYGNGNIGYKYYKNDRGQIHGLAIGYYTNTNSNIWYKQNWFNDKPYGLDTLYNKINSGINNQIYYL